MGSMNEVAFAPRLFTWLSIRGCGVDVCGVISDLDLEKRFPRFVQLLCSAIRLGE